MNATLSRHSLIGEFARSVRDFLQRGLFMTAIVLIITDALLWSSGNPGATAFAAIAGGFLVIMIAWRSHGIGLPVMPVLALQTLVAFGLPIVVGHQVLQEYPEDFIDEAGIQVLIFCLALLVSWRAGMTMLRTAPGDCYALRGYERQRGAALQRLGFSLASVATGYQVLQSMNLVDPILALLPGAFSLANALVAAMSTCGFFLLAMTTGAKELHASKQTAFWLLLAVNCFIGAAGFLLSTTTAVLGAVVIGLFWGGGRVPWRFLTVVLVILGFFNMGKFTMRDRYWNLAEGGSAPQFALTEMPGHYLEWIDASLQGLSVRDASRDRTKTDGQGQTLLERINNLQNLLFVIDAIDRQHIAPIGGGTYSIIPSLLIPRILWPDKPRSHEGQVILNVHFGRQELDSTFQTYIAWGLLPEAYGNFGAGLGAIFLGLVLGFALAWVEKATARKQLMSLEGFIAFSFLLGFANSYEMVASVLVTSVFQSAMTLVVACFPFVARQRPTLALV